jgi:hypothetical protein
MKRTLVIVGSLFAMLLLAVGATSSFGSAGHSTARTGKITIQSWLLANPVEGDLSGTVKACFKLNGAFKDEGGQPTWKDGTYASTSDLAAKCGDWTPVGGYNFGPTASNDHPEWSTLYAVHTLAGRQGLIFITFAGHYDLQSTYQGTGTWVITGGTGAYQNARGEGTWTADAGKFPYIRHTETGVMSK